MVKSKKNQNAREFSKRRFLLAGIITILMFLVGIMFGMLLDNERYARQTKNEESQKLDYESLQLQYLYINQLSEKNETCGALSKALERTVSDLGDLLEKVLEAEDENPIRNPDYGNLYRSYIQSNFKYWLLAEKAKERCDFDSVIILYFFSEKNCDICPDQGVVLTYYKKKYDEKILIFPVNMDLAEEEPFINLVQSSFNIESLPSLVIDDIVYKGVVSKEKLSEILCRQNKNMCD